MKVYLLRHGVYQSEPLELGQPLNEEGKKEIEKLSLFISNRSLRVSKIVHSGKLRAKQTAEIIAGGFSFNDKIEVNPDLSPSSAIQPVFSELNQATEDIVLVGHLPFMEKLLGKMVADDENKKVVNFEPGTFVCVERQGTEWAISWVLFPQLFL